MGGLGLFGLANAVGLAVLVLAPAPWVEHAVSPDFARRIFDHHLPWDLALATLLTLVLAARSRAPGPLLARHALFWLAPIVALGLFALWTDVPDGALGLPLVAIVAGIAAQGLSWLWRTRHARSDREIGLLLGLTLLCASLALLPYEASRQRAEADEPHYLLMMASLVRDHDLDLRDQYDDPAQYDEFYWGTLPDRHVIEVGTHQYPIRDPGLPLLGAIPFGLGGRAGVLALMCLVVAAFTWRLFAYLRWLAVPRDATFLAVALAFLHPIFTYTTQIYPDVVALLLVLLVAELLSRAPTAARLAAASALTGFLPVLSARLWFPAIGLGLVLAFVALRSRRAPLVAAAALPGLALVGADVALDWALFRLAIPNAGYFVIRDQQEVLAYTPWVGATGLVLDRAYGLLSRAPLYLLAFAGAVPLVRRLRAAPPPGLVALALAWAFYLAYIADVRYWHADYSPSTRYQLATLSFLVIASALGMPVLRARLARLAAWLAAAWSVFVTLGFAIEPVLRHDSSIDMAGTDGAGKFWSAVRDTMGVDPGALFPSLFRGAPEDWALALAWIGILAAVAIAGARLATPGAHLGEEVEVRPDDARPRVRRVDERAS